MRGIEPTRALAVNPPHRPRPWLRLVLPLALAVSTAAAADDDERCTDSKFRDSYSCRQVIVKYGPGFDPAHLSSSHPGLSVIGLIPELAQAWIEAPRGSQVEQLIDELTAPPPLGEPGVRSAERNGEYVSPECRQLNAPILDAQGATPSTLLHQAALGAMHVCPDASFGTATVVAVLDTGIDRAHPALAGGRFLPGIDLVSGGDAGDRGDGIDQDGNGVVDDGYGHGTAVAGLIHLVAPGAVLLPVRVLDDECRGTAFALASGVVQAVAGGARVLNASLGGHEPSAAVAEAFDYAAAHGVLVVAAAGNTRTPRVSEEREEEEEGDEDMEIQFPASHRDSLAVAAVNTAYVAAPSTVHDRRVGLCAPGVDVLAPWRSGYARVTGTSFASALVSGAAATGLARHPALGRLELAQLLRATAIPVDLWNPGLEGELGSGVPDVAVLASPAPRLPAGARVPRSPAHTRGTARHPAGRRDRD